jgi:hypothetical protein
MQSEVAAGAEVLALGAKHLQPLGTVQYEQVAVCIRGEGCRAKELAVLLALGAELPRVVALAIKICTWWLAASAATATSPDEPSTVTPRG